MVPGKTIPFYEGLPYFTEAPGTHRIFLLHHDMEKEYKIGWGWRHVRIWPATLSRLFKDGYLENVFKSNSHTGYRLSELGKAAIVKASSETAQTPQNQKISLDDDLFEDSPPSVTMK